mmetsp:Transcript_52098/g.144336  ORF Transcript_52098/g.144336 Transcript_52098/m.144336 type:complete len:203 (-) Transcript_52098:117-725(-)
MAAAKVRGHLQLDDVDDPLVAEDGVQAAPEGAERFRGAHRDEPALAQQHGGVLRGRGLQGRPSHLLQHVLVGRPLALLQRGGLPVQHEALRQAVHQRGLRARRDGALGAAEAARPAAHGIEAARDGRLRRATSPRRLGPRCARRGRRLGPQRLEVPRVGPAMGGVLPAAHGDGRRQGRARRRQSASGLLQGCGYGVGGPGLK